MVGKKRDKRFVKKYVLAKLVDAYPQHCRSHLELIMEGVISTHCKVTLENTLLRHLHNFMASFDGAANTGKATSQTRTCTVPVVKSTCPSINSTSTQTSNKVTSNGSVLATAETSSSRCITSSGTQSFKRVPFIGTVPAATKVLTSTCTSSSVNSAGTQTSCMVTSTGKVPAATEVVTSTSTSASTTKRTNLQHTTALTNSEVYMQCRRKVATLQKSSTSNVQCGVEDERFIMQLELEFVKFKLPYVEAGWAESQLRKMGITPCCGERLVEKIQAKELQAHFYQSKFMRNTTKTMSEKAAESTDQAAASLEPIPGVSGTTRRKRRSNIIDVTSPKRKQQLASQYSSCSEASVESTVPEEEIANDLEKVLPPLAVDLLDDQLLKEEKARMKLIRCPSCGYTATMEVTETRFMCENTDCQCWSCRYCKRDWLHEILHENCTPNTKPGEVPLPKHWTPMDPNTREYTAVEMTSDDPLYQMVVDLARDGPPRYSLREDNIVSIKKIQNPRLWKFYAMKRELMLQDNGADELNEMYLFHGTSPKNTTAISQENFDWRLAGVHGHSLGYGSYFSKYSDYSLKYCVDKLDWKDFTKTGSYGMVPHPGPAKYCMFVASVLVGRTTRGAYNLRRPPQTSLNGHPYDSVSETGDMSGKRIAVFDSMQTYPSFQIEFCSKRKRLCPTPKAKSKHSQ